MSESRDGTHRVLAQADALMSRHRVFVAGANSASSETSPESRLETLPAPDEDIPVLTEIVAHSDIADPPTAQPVEEMLANQRLHIEQTVEQWMDERLPEEILRVMDGISDQLIGTLVSKMRDELLPQLLATTYPLLGDDACRKPGKEL